MSEYTEVKDQAAKAKKGPRANQPHLSVSLDDGKALDWQLPLTCSYWLKR